MSFWFEAAPTGKLGTFCPPLGGEYGIELAPYAEPPDDVVTKASPSSFHRCLLLSSASKLPESTSLFDPGMRELSDLRSLPVDLLCLFGLHLGLEVDRGGGLLDARDDPPPFGSRFLGSTFVTVYAGATSRRGRLVQMREHPVTPIQDSLMT